MQNILILKVRSGQMNIPLSKGKPMLYVWVRLGFILFERFLFMTCYRDNYL